MDAEGNWVRAWSFRAKMEHLDAFDLVSLLLGYHGSLGRCAVDAPEHVKSSYGEAIRHTIAVVGRSRRGLLPCTAGRAWAGLELRAPGRSQAFVGRSRAAGQLQRTPHSNARHGRHPAGLRARPGCIPTRSAGPMAPQRRSAACSSNGITFYAVKGSKTVAGQRQRRDDRHRRRLRRSQCPSDLNTFSYVLRSAAIQRGGRADVHEVE